MTRKIIIFMLLFIFVSCLSGSTIKKSNSYLFLKNVIWLTYPKYDYKKIKQVCFLKSGLKQEAQLKKIFDISNRYKTKLIDEGLLNKDINITKNKETIKKINYEINKLNKIKNEISKKIFEPDEYIIKNIKLNNKKKNPENKNKNFQKEEEELKKLKRQYQKKITSLNKKIRFYSRQIKILNKQIDDLNKKNKIIHHQLVQQKTKDCQVVIRVYRKEIKGRIILKHGRCTKHKKWYDLQTKQWYGNYDTHCTAPIYGNEYWYSVLAIDVNQEKYIAKNSFRLKELLPKVIPLFFVYPKQGLFYINKLKYHPKNEMVFKQNTIMATGYKHYGGFAMVETGFLKPLLYILDMSLAKRHNNDPFLIFSGEFKKIFKNEYDKRYLSKSSINIIQFFKNKQKDIVQKYKVPFLKFMKELQAIIKFLKPYVANFNKGDFNYLSNLDNLFHKYKTSKK